jgi:hypothetical protein
VRDADDKKKYDMAYARNAMAVMMEEPNSNELVRRSVSTVYPEGDATLGWQTLANRNVLIVTPNGLYKIIMSVMSFKVN